jgi:ribosomal protein S18 acetylase RimI-like enzyme
MDLKNKSKKHMKENESTIQNINNIRIRELEPNEVNILEDLLYVSIYQPDDNNPIPRDVINIPQVRVYIENFGQKKNDYCLVADLNARIIGAVWIRVLADEIKGYGNVDNKTPEFAISVFREYHKQGIGTLLMKKMIFYLVESGYSQTSLSVHKMNYAVKMYKNLGFEIIRENKDDYIMLLKLKYFEK